MKENGYEKENGYKKTSKLLRFGTSRGIILPKFFLRQVNISETDWFIKIGLHEGKIVITKKE